MRHALKILQNWKSGCIPSSKAELSNCEEVVACDAKPDADLNRFSKFEVCFPSPKGAFAHKVAGEDIPLLLKEGRREARGG